MLDRIMVNQTFKPENPHVVRHGGVIINSIYSQAFSFGDDMSKFKRADAPLCACGCGERTKWCDTYKRWNKFINGHNSRGTNNPAKKPGVGKKISIALKGSKRSLESKKRMSIAQTGKKQSLETRRKRSESTIGKPRPKGYIHTQKAKDAISKATKGKCNPFYGKTHTPKTLLKMIINQNPNHPRWKGGISAEPYCFIWGDQDFKKFIKERDGRECQNPGCRGNCNHLPLTIHHIDYVKKNCGPDNLITVCVGCNSRANFNKEYWIKLYQEIMAKKYGCTYQKGK